MTVREDLAVTAEIIGATLSETAARILIAELEHYDERALHASLARCRRELHGRLTLAAIIERLDDGRPGPEEAWALLPKSEADSAVVTDDMRQAMGPALRLLADGDEKAARMAFLEAYRHRVAEARAMHKPVNWFPSLGHDPAGRTGVLIDAARLGLIGREQAVTCAGTLAGDVEAGLNGAPVPELAAPRPTAEPRRIGVIRQLSEKREEE